MDFLLWRMLYLRKFTFVLLVAIGIGAVIPARVHGGAALDQVRGTVDQVLVVLNDAKFAGDSGKQKQREQLRETIYPRFDFVEMSRRALGSRWKEITSEQQNDFVQVFTKLLEESYLSNIQGFKGVKVLYLGNTQEQEYARVDTKILSKEGDQTAVNYSLHKVADDWKVYDVVVENISIVNNYRAQLNRLLGQMSFVDVLGQLRDKVAAAEKTLH